MLTALSDEAVVRRVFSNLDTSVTVADPHRAVANGMTARGIGEQGNAEMERLLAETSAKAERLAKNSTEFANEAYAQKRIVELLLSVQQGGQENSQERAEELRQAVPELTAVAPGVDWENADISDAGIRLMLGIAGYLKALLDQVRLKQLADRGPAFREYIHLKILAARAKYPDFDTVTAGNPASGEGLILSAFETEFFALSPWGADVLYYLGKNREESVRIFNLSPDQQLTELSGIEFALQTDVEGGSAWVL